MATVTQKKNETNTQQIRIWWDRMQKWPMGSHLFSKFIGYLAPYSGSIRVHVLELREGYGKVQLKDRRRVRNHLRSIHAMALANLGEIVSGLSFLYGLPSGARAILTGFSIAYLKKARGTLIAECSCPILDSTEERELEFEAVIRDDSGEIVARARPIWRVGPRKK